MTPLPQPMRISNARDRSIAQGGASPVPSMATTLYGILEPCVFVLVLKQQDPTTLRIIEIKQPISTAASHQPLKNREIEIKPEGQRSWTWIKVFALPDCPLQPKDVVILPWPEFNGQPFRIMGSKPWQSKGFMYYEMVADYQARGALPGV